jgi:hypothetical protein
MDFDTFKSLAETFGIPVVILIYFVWTDFTRRKDDKAEKAGIIKNLKAVEDFQKEKMSTMIEGSATVIERNTQVIDRNSDVLEHIRDKFQLKRSGDAREDRYLDER